MNQSPITSKTIKVEFKTELPYLLVILPGIFILCVLARKSFLDTWPIILIVAISILLFSVLLYRLNEIEIDTQTGNVILVESNLLRSKRTKTYPLKDLQFSYKIGKPGLRHEVVNICTLYIKRKQIAELIPDQDGWTEDTVNEVAKNLIQLGITKKFIGYSTKDAEINGL